MKKLVLWMMVFSMSLAHAGGKEKSTGVGNGGPGDSDAQAFRAYAYEIHKVLTPYVHNDLPMIHPIRFLNAVERTKIEFVDRPLWLIDSKTKKKKFYDALNFPDKNTPLIQVYRKNWRAIRTEVAKRLLVLHEFLGILGWDDVDYQTSAQFKPILQKIDGGPIDYHLAVEKGGRLLSEVIRGNRAEAVALLRDGADPNIKDQNGNGPLFHAAWRGDDFLVSQLLSAGAFINSKGNDTGDERGWTAIKAALYRGHVAVFTRLLHNGASLYRGVRLVCDGSYCGPIEYAASADRSLSLLNSILNFLSVHSVYSYGGHGGGIYFFESGDIGDRYFTDLKAAYRAAGLLGHCEESPVTHVRAWPSLVPPKEGYPVRFILEQIDGFISGAKKWISAPDEENSYALGVLERGFRDGCGYLVSDLYRRFPDFKQYFPLRLATRHEWDSWEGDELAKMNQFWLTALRAEDLRFEADSNLASRWAAFATLHGNEELLTEVAERGATFTTNSSIYLSQWAPRDGWVGSYHTVWDSYLKKLQDELWLSSWGGHLVEKYMGEEISLPMLAVLNQNHAALRFLVKKNADLEFKDKLLGITALTAAVRLGDLESVKILVEANPTLVFWRGVEDWVQMDERDFPDWYGEFRMGALPMGSLLFHTDQKEIVRVLLDAGLKPRGDDLLHLIDSIYDFSSTEELDHFFELAELLISKGLKVKRSARARYRSRMYRWQERQTEGFRRVDAHVFSRREVRRLNRKNRRLLR